MKETIDKLFETREDAVEVADAKNANALDGDLKWVVEPAKNGWVVTRYLLNGKQVQRG